MTKWGEGPPADLSQSATARELPSGGPHYEGPSLMAANHREATCEPLLLCPQVASPTVVCSASSSLLPHLDWKLQVKEPSESSSDPESQGSHSEVQCQMEENRTDILDCF